MHREITYEQSDCYCRYLDIAINYTPSKKICGGRFASFLEKSLGIEKLPFDINLIDLVLERVLTPELFVALPKEFFLQWTNYPARSAIFGSEVNDDIKDAGLYNTYINRTGKETNLSDFIHPYDAPLKNIFVDKFSIQIPHDLEPIEHSNGRIFYPYEAYFSYWKAYIILESLEECKFIDRYLDAEKGIAMFKNITRKINDHWNVKYSAVFDRLSHFKTFTNQFNLSGAKIDCSYGDIAKHLLKRTESSAAVLEADLECLLELHHTWQAKYKRNGINNFEFAINLLKRDIYFLFEWLCSSGYREVDLFKKWKYKNRQQLSWSQLKDVLDFEEIIFSDTFEMYAPIYSQNISKWISKIDIAKSYEKLQTHDSFWPWIRAFYDLHTAINRKEKIRLVQPRILDNLLVLTIRTEIILRSIYSNITGKEDSDTLQKLIRKMGDIVWDEQGKVILNAVSDTNQWKLTKLYHRPENMFHQIESCKIGKKWSNEQKYFCQCLLKFVAARNYFAHHSYKDNGLNSQLSELSEGVLIACLHSILYIQSITDRG